MSKPASSTARLIAFLLLLLAAYEWSEARRWKRNYDIVHKELHQLEEKCEVVK